MARWFEMRDLRGAVEDFTHALGTLGDTSNCTADALKWKVEALMRRAQCSSHLVSFQF